MASGSPSTEVAAGGSFGTSMVTRVRSRSAVRRRLGRASSVGRIGRTSLGFSRAIGRASAVRPVVTLDTVNSASLRPPILWRRPDDPASPEVVPEAAPTTDAGRRPSWTDALLGDRPTVVASARRAEVAPTGDRKLDALRRLLAAGPSPEPSVGSEPELRPDTRGAAGGRLADSGRGDTFAGSTTGPGRLAERSRPEPVDTDELARRDVSSSGVGGPRRSAGAPSSGGATRPGTSRPSTPSRTQRRIESLRRMLEESGKLDPEPPGSGPSADAATAPTTSRRPGSSTPAERPARSSPGQRSDGTGPSSPGSRSDGPSVSSAPIPGSDGPRSSSSPDEGPPPGTPVGTSDRSGPSVDDPSPAYELLDGAYDERSRRAAVLRRMLASQTEPPTVDRTTPAEPTTIDAVPTRPPAAASAVAVATPVSAPRAVADLRHRRRAGLPLVFSRLERPGPPRVDTIARAAPPTAIPPDVAATSSGGPAAGHMATVAAGTSTSAIGAWSSADPVPTAIHSWADPAVAPAATDLRARARRGVPRGAPPADPNVLRTVLRRVTSSHASTEPGRASMPRRSAERSAASEITTTAPSVGVDVSAATERPTARPAGPADTPRAAGPAARPVRDDQRAAPRPPTVPPADRGTGSTDAARPTSTDTGPQPVGRTSRNGPARVAAEATAAPAAPRRAARDDAIVRRSPLHSPSELADRFLAELGQRRTEAGALPTTFRPLAAMIVGERRVALSTDTRSVRALRAVGRPAATVDDTIHLDRQAVSEARVPEVLAHELVHVANPSPAPRFFDDVVDSPEERMAVEVGRAMSRSRVGLGVGAARSASASRPGPTPAGRTSSGTVDAASLAASITGGSPPIVRRSPSRPSASAPSASAPSGDASPVVRRFADSTWSGSGSGSGTSSATWDSSSASEETGSSGGHPGISDEDFEQLLERNLDRVMHLLDDRIQRELDRRGGRQWRMIR